MTIGLDLGRLVSSALSMAFGSAPRAEAESRLAACRECSWRRWSRITLPSFLLPEDQRADFARPVALLRCGVCRCVVGTVGPDHVAEAEVSPDQSERRRVYSLRVVPAGKSTLESFDCPIGRWPKRSGET